MKAFADQHEAFTDQHKATWERLAKVLAEKVYWQGTPRGSAFNDAETKIITDLFDLECITRSARVTSSVWNKGNAYVNVHEWGALSELISCAP